MRKRLSVFLDRFRFLRANEPVFRRARLWSNIEIARIAPRFKGRVINVSGWADEDKFGDVYRNYFKGADEYLVSNLGGGRQTGMERTLEDSLDIDLNAPLSERHFQAYDCVFTHTVFEHVFNIFQAAKNICDMSRDSIIFIVPFVQSVHYEEGGYSDYWRMTPFCIERLFCEHGFKPVYRKGVDLPGSSIYYLYVLSKHPERHAGSFELSGFKDLPLGDDIYTARRIRRFLKYLWFRQDEFDV